jgi:hypothetical protein
VTASLRKSIILFNSLFIGLIYFAGAPPTGLIFLTFAVVAITLINLHKVRFCNNCGATTGLFRKGILPDSACPKCGTPFIRVGTRNNR